MHGGNAPNATKPQFLLGFIHLAGSTRKAKRRGRVARGPLKTERLTKMVLKTPLGARRPRSWKCLGRSWSSLGRLKGALVLPWAPLGRSWAALGRVLGAEWALLASWLPNAAQDSLDLDFSPILARFLPLFEKGRASVIQTIAGGTLF